MFSNPGRIVLPTLLSLNKKTVQATRLATQCNLRLKRKFGHVHDPDGR